MTADRLGSGMQGRAAFFDTLVQVPELLAGAADRWWVIGSAALALHGVPVEVEDDIDLLTSAADARRILRSREIQPAAGRSDGRFRSEVFGTLTGLPLRVEIMGGLNLHAEGAWRPVRIRTRVAVPVGGGLVYVPNAPELKRLLTAFGRPKDLERARLLPAELGLHRA